MIKQTYEVDTVATATESSEGWKEAVKNALEEAQ
ncbi:FMN-binding protein [Schnuerera sp. xch1]|nr:FMN-binding protein [Schnuerera sp. xch1]MBZ2175466.1 FMN-binding protein [Schnuerera sp. xch1]